MPPYPYIGYYSTTTKYIFECDICHGEICLYDKEALIKCVACGMKLCEKCSRFNLCPTDLARIPMEGQETLHQIGEKYRLAEDAVTQRRKIHYRNFSISALVMIASLFLGLFMTPNIIVNIIIVSVFSFSALPFVLKNVFAISTDDSEKVDLQARYKVDLESTICIYLPVQDPGVKKTNSGLE